MAASENSIGSLLREARINRGLSIRQVGRLIDASESQISKWENGVVTPGSDVLLRYRKARLLRIGVGAA